jgi:hypothetical protein
MTVLVVGCWDGMGGATSGSVAGDWVRAVDQPQYEAGEYPILEEEVKMDQATRVGPGCLRLWGMW